MIYLVGGKSKEQTLIGVDKIIINDILGAENPVLVGVEEGIDTSVHKQLIH